MENNNNKLSVTKENGIYIVRIAGMEERFASERELRLYISTIQDQCNSRIGGKAFVRDEPNGKISIVHNVSKNALILKNAAQGLLYAEKVELALAKIPKSCPHLCDGDGGKKKCDLGKQVNLYYGECYNQCKERKDKK